MMFASIPPEVRDYFTYDPETGLIARIRTERGDECAARVLGVRTREGKHIGIFHRGVGIQAHRLAWFLHYGIDPVGVVDHVNGDPRDNRICNLREASWQQNNFNQRRKRNARSPLKGAQFHSRSGKYRSAIRISDGSRVFLGNFDTYTEAHDAYVAAAKKYHGEFARTE